MRYPLNQLPTIRWLARTGSKQTQAEQGITQVSAFGPAALSPSNALLSFVLAAAYWL